METPLGGALGVEEVRVGLPQVLQSLVTHLALGSAVQGEHRALPGEAAEGAFSVHPGL